MTQAVTFSWAPLLGQDVLTTAVAPKVGYINVYNLADGAFAVTLRQASVGTLGVLTLIELDPNDVSGNALTINCLPGETFADGSTTRTITDPGTFLVLSTVAGSDDVARWKEVGGSNLPATNSVTRWGAKFDGKRRYDATILAGSLNIVRCTGYNFTAGDVGKTIIIGGGASATPYQAHITTIASLSGNNAVLTAAATNAVTTAWIAWGTDDGPAWLSALTNATNTHDAQLTMPAGLSICGQAISLAPTNTVIELFSLRGASVGTSEIICTAAGGFLTLDVTGTLWGGCSSVFDFRDLTLTSAFAGASHALSVTATGTGGTNYRGFVAENILCQGFDYSHGAGYWDKPIEVIGMYAPYLCNVVVYGLTVPSSAGNTSDTSPLFMATLGINLNQCFTPELAHVQVSGFKRGLQLIATVNSQGGFMNEMLVFGCREGFYCKVTSSSGQPQFTIAGGVWSCRDFAICMDTRQWAIVSNVYCNGYLGTPAQSSTLATAVTTGSSPTTLTLASTAGFPEVGAVRIGNEWFTYNNLAAGMNGTTLNNVTRAQFGTSDPGSTYAIGATVVAALMGIVLMNTIGTRVDNTIFSPYPSNDRINVLLHSGNTNCSVSNSYCDTNGIGIGVAISNDSVGTGTSDNTYALGTVPVLSLTHGVTRPATFPSYDNSAKSSHQSAVASGTPMTMSYAAAANAGLVVTLYGSTGGSGGPATDTATVTFGGQTLTSKGWIYDANAPSLPWQWIFTLDNQLGGADAQTLSATVYGHAFTGYIAVASYTNVPSFGNLQTGTIAANTTSPKMNATAEFSGDILWASILASPGSVVFSSPNFTQRQTGNSSPSFLMGDTTGVLGLTNLHATLDSAQSWSVAALDIGGSPSASNPLAGRGVFFPADGSLHYVGPATDTQVAPA